MTAQPLPSYLVVGGFAAVVKTWENVIRPCLDSMGVEEVESAPLEFVERIGNRLLTDLRYAGIPEDRMVEFAAEVRTLVGPGVPESTEDLSAVLAWSGTDREDVSWWRYFRDAMSVLS